MREDKLPEEMLTATALQVAAAVSGAASEGIKGTVAEAWGGLIGDRVRQWRIRNLVNSPERTADFLAEKGIALEKARALPDGVLYSIFEGASKEDEPEIQELWAGLLAGQAAGEEIGVPLKVVTSCLSGMSSADARLLRFMIMFEGEVETFNAEAQARGAQQVKAHNDISDAAERRSFLEATQKNNALRLEEFAAEYNVDCKKFSWQRRVLGRSQNTTSCGLG